MDAEEPQLRQRLNRNQVGEGNSTGPSHHPVGLPPHHPVNLLYRIGVMSASLYGLHEMDVFHQITRGPNVDHQWFKIGLAASVGEFSLRLCLSLPVR